MHRLFKIKWRAQPVLLTLSIVNRSGQSEEQQEQDGRLHRCGTGGIQQLIGRRLHRQFPPFVSGRRKDLQLLDVYDECKG